MAQGSKKLYKTFVSLPLFQRVKSATTLDREQMLSWEHAVKVRADCGKWLSTSAR